MGVQLRRVFQKFVPVILPSVLQIQLSYGSLFDFEQIQSFLLYQLLYTHFALFIWDKYEIQIQFFNFPSNTQYPPSEIYTITQNLKTISIPLFKF